MVIFTWSNLWLFFWNNMALHKKWCIHQQTRIVVWTFKAHLWMWSLTNNSLFIQTKRQTFCMAISWRLYHWNIIWIFRILLSRNCFWHIHLDIQWLQFKSQWPHLSSLLCCMGCHIFHMDQILLTRIFKMVQPTLYKTVCYSFLHLRHISYLQHYSYYPNSH